MAATRLTPFGDPDGSREDIDHRTSWFVRPTDEPESVYSRTRVLVGGKGSGKTVLLRILQANARRDSSRYVAGSISIKPPQTSSVIRFCESVPAGALAEAWEGGWRCAILRSLVSHVLCTPELLARLATKDMERLQADYGGLVPTYREPRSIYAELSEIIGRADSRGSLLARLHDPRWEDLETLFDRILERMPPIYFFVDAIDEKFEEAPAHWRHCQRGLFDSVISYMRSQVFGERLHIVISIRDSVYYSALRSEHRTRYLDARILRLHWDLERLRELLAKKVDQLPESLRRGSIEAQDPVERWLGVTTIKNHKRERDEAVFSYLRRHMRPAPRDFVVLGNDLCDRLRVAVSPVGVETLVRLAVAHVAGEIGRESLHICAAQIAADMLPSHAATHGYEDAYVATSEYRMSIVDRLASLVRGHLPGDRFKGVFLQKLDAAARECFHWDIDVPSALWQIGLIGYVDSSDKRETHRFWFTGGSQSATLPTHCSEYVLHPSLIDALSIDSKGRTPVVPEL